MMSSLARVTARDVERVRVLVSDSNRMSSQLLAESIERDPRFEIVAVPRSEEILASASSHRPHVAVISAEFDGSTKTGLQVARALSARSPEIRILILMNDSTMENVIAAFRCGARGVFSRADSASDLPTCIERVGRGEIWAGPAEAEFLLDAIRNSPSTNGLDNQALATLSKRELQVTESVGQGKSNKQIADQLQISEHTVKNYLFRIFEKLGVSNRFELLFMLYNARDSQFRSNRGQRLPAHAHANSWEKAAEEGCTDAQVLLGVAYLEGNLAEKSTSSAYYWLRTAALSCDALQQRCESLLDELRLKMSSNELSLVEARIETTMQGRNFLTAEQADDMLRQRVTTFHYAQQLS